MADYFASLGLVGVNATYRLAPEAKFPDGANDIGAAVAWVKDNIAEYGGDPNQVFVIGKSAAASHAATYAFRSAGGRDSRSTRLGTKAVRLSRPEACTRRA